MEDSRHLQQVMHSQHQGLMDIHSGVGNHLHPHSSNLLQLLPLSNNPQHNQGIQDMLLNQLQLQAILHTVLQGNQAHHKVLHLLPGHMVIMAL